MALMEEKMSILSNILISAVGCLIAMFLFIACIFVYDCIYEIREEKKRAEFWRDNW